MKRRNRYPVLLGLFAFLLLCMVPAGEAQQGAPTQVSWLPFSLTTISPPTNGLAAGGLTYWQIKFVVSGSISVCSLALDSSNDGFTWTAGGAIASGTIGSCANSGAYITPTSTTPFNFVRLNSSITGTGTLTVSLFGYTLNPATAGGGGGAITSPVDGSGFVEVNCKTGCSGSNPNGQALMANSAPVVIASNQSNLPVALQNAIPAGTNLIGSAKVTDGTNTQAVKAASTAAIATDPAAVVTISPNTPLPTGTNTLGALNQGTAGSGTSGWPVIGGNLALSTASWTSGTSANTALTATVTGYNSVQVFLNQGSTLTGGAVTFEGSDTAGFTNAFPIQCAAANSFIVASVYSLVVSTNQSFDCDVSGFVAFRVRLSTVISGSGTVALSFAAQAMATTPETAVGGTVNVQDTSGNAILADPCARLPRTTFVINQTANGQIIVGVASKKTYVCYLQFSISGTADNVALVEGTGTTCAVSTVGMAGGNTAALGWNLLANGSVTSGQGTSYAFVTATNADNVCLFVSSASQVSGVIQYVQL